MSDQEKKELTDDEIKDLFAKRIKEMKDHIPDLQVEEEYWRLKASIYQSQHIIFNINLQKANYAADNANSDKEENK